MPRLPEDIMREEEQRAKSASELIRMRLNTLEKNIAIPVKIPPRPERPKPRPPPDFVRNVVGSSAAAGSADFHIFRNNRKREMDRLEFIEREAQQEELDREFDEKREALKRAADEKTAKKRAKRQKRKQRIRANRKGKKGDKEGDKEDDNDEDETDSSDDGQ